MREADKRKFTSLVDWARQTGARLHPSVEIYHDDVTGFSLRVASDADALEQGGTEITTCPLAATISYLNAVVDGPVTRDVVRRKAKHDSGLRAAFPARFMETIAPHVVGRFYLMQQYLLGERSFWWPYMQTLPPPDRVASWALPAFWPDEDTVFLDGTNAEVAVKEMSDLVKREYKQARRMLKEEEDFPGWQGYTRLLYNWAFCIFTSRSFRPSLVLSVRMEENLRIARILGPECQLDDFSVLMPLFDIANHSPTARVYWLVEDETDTSRSIDTVSTGSCHLICLDGYASSAQILNNYGMKTNSELLLAYGFIIPETSHLHNDYVHVRKRGDVPTEGGPRDFLISLRPLDDASSVVGRARQLMLPAKVHRRRDLSHIEDALLWDLALAIMTDGERLALEAHAAASPTQTEDQLPLLIGAPTPPDFEDLVARLVAALKTKLMHDAERLNSVCGEHEGVKVGSGCEVHCTDSKDEASATQRQAKTQPHNHNRNQLLASAYRRQTRRVLRAALASLGATNELRG